ncbi:unnamed protein product [Absidia cylindrospora]
MNSCSPVISLCQDITALLETNQTRNTKHLANILMCSLSWTYGLDTNYITIMYQNDVKLHNQGTDSNELDFFGKAILLACFDGITGALLGEPLDIFDLTQERQYGGQYQCIKKVWTLGTTNV